MPILRSTLKLQLFQSILNRIELSLYKLLVIILFIALRIKKAIFNWVYINFFNYSIYLNHGGVNDANTLLPKLSEMIEGLK